MNGSLAATAQPSEPERRGGVLYAWNSRIWMARLWLGPAILAAALVMVACNSLHRLKERVVSERQAKIRAAVQMAYGAIARAGELAASGEKTRAEAQRMAINVVRALRYEDGQYLLIVDVARRVVLHPVSPELEGKDLSDYIDPCGARPFATFVEAAQRLPDGDFVKYCWPKPRGGAPVAKVSFVKLYQPWGWVIGSGAYLDEMDSLLSSEAQRIIGSTLLLGLLLCSAGVAIAWNARRADRLAMEQERAERLAREQERALQTLTRCNQALVESEDEGSLLRSVCRILVDSAGYPTAWVGFAEHDERKTVRTVVAAGDASDELASVDEVWAEGSAACGPMGTAIRTGRPAIARDVGSEPASTPWRALARRRGVHCVIALPLVVSGSAIGALGIHVPSSRCLDEDATKFLVDMAHDLVFGIVALRHRVEHERMTSQLAQTDRLVAMGSLAAGVAHEINNPLAYVAAGAEFLAGELGGEAGELRGGRLAEARNVVEDMRDGCNRIRQVVRDLRTFSRSDERSIRPLDVHDILDASARIAFSEIRHRARLVKEYGSTPPVRANETRLGQVFLNLLVNAAQAIPEGASASNEVVVATWTDGEGRAVVEIRDTGVGIAPEHVGRIFDPFFTTKPPGVGTGLGLAISRDLVTAMGGGLSVQSDLGRGSAFRVVLPRWDGEAPHLATSDAAEPAGRRGRILVIDDEPLVLSALRRLLSPEHDVVTETSAGAALRRLASGERFDLVLCDVMMPERSGVEVHAEIARLDPTLAHRVVFLTAGAPTPSAKAFVGSMAGRVLEKPFDAGSLRSMVRRLVA